MIVVVGVVLEPLVKLADRLPSVAFQLEKKSVKKKIAKSKFFFWPIPTTYECRLRIQSFIKIGPPVPEL